MNLQTRLSLTIAMVSFISSSVAYAENSCSSLLQQAKQAGDKQKIYLYQQAVMCEQSFDVYYQQGLALSKSKLFAEAEKAFKLADNALDSEDEEYHDKRIMAIGRQAATAWDRHSRVDARLLLNKVDHITKDYQVDKPAWLLLLQKEIDDSINQKPFNKAELKSLLNTSRGLGVEPTLDYQITFDFNTATMTSDGEALLSKVVESFQDIHSNVVVVGHTDTKGDATYNQNLSERRAVAIKKALVAKMPSLAKQLTTQGKGKTEPKYNGDTPDDDQRNRRVEFVFSRN